MLIVLPIATTPYLSRVLGPGQLGTYSYSYSVAYYFVLIAMLGINNYGTRCIAKNRDDEATLSKTFCEIYSLQAAIAVLSTIVYILYAFTVSDNSIVPLVWIPYVVSAALDINWLFFGLEEFKITVVRSFIVKLSTFVLIFAFVNGEYALIIYCILISGGFLISAISLWPFVYGRIQFVKPALPDVMSHLKPNLVLFVPVIAISLYTVFDKIMLGAMTDMTQVGYFDNALKVAEMPISLISALGTVMLPRTAHLLSRGETNEAHRNIDSSIWFATALSFAFAFGLCGVADVFAPVFFGEEFRACSGLMCVLVMSMPFMAWANVLRTQFLIPLGRDRAYVVSVGLGATVNVGLNIALIPYLGAAGASFGTLAAEMTVCFAQAWTVRNDLPQLRWLIRAVPFAVIGALMFIAVRTLGFVMGESLLTLVCQIATGVIVFFVLSLIWCKLISDQTFESIIVPMMTSEIRKRRF